MVATIRSHSPPFYGLDIETDTAIDGLDPSVAAIVAVAISGVDFEWVFDGNEASILTRTDSALAELDPGVVVTWNGAAFDLPFIADRARRLGLSIGLHLQLDAGIGGHRDPLAGHEGAYRGQWFGHRHLDGYQLYRADVGASVGMSCGLKPMARFVGLPVVEVDRERIHELTHAECRAYVASDARLARLLVGRRSTAMRAADQLFVSRG